VTVLTAFLTRLAERLLRCDVANYPEELSVNVLSSLVRYAPDEKEQKALLDFTGGVNIHAKASRSSWQFSYHRL
jgi:hypothetical protein